MTISQLKMKAGGLLPVGFFTRGGLSILGAIFTRRLIVKGLVSHPIATLRSIALLSVE